MFESAMGYIRNTSLIPHAVWWYSSNQRLIKGAIMHMIM